MATALRKIFSETGTRAPRSASTPSAKAMSVAAGIAQPRRVPAPAIEHGIDQGRHRHAAERREAGQHPVGPGAQLPVQHLALDLQPDQQEEHRHQAVVDPVQHAHRPESGVERVRVGLGQGPVGDDQRQRRRRHQDQAARRLAREHRAEGRERARAPGRRGAAGIWRAASSGTGSAALSGAGQGAGARTSDERHALQPRPAIAYRYAMSDRLLSLVVDEPYRHGSDAQGRRVSANSTRVRTLGRGDR